MADSAPEPPSGDASRAELPPSPPGGMPRWVKIFVGIAAATAVVIVVLLLSGGNHGPDRHKSDQHFPSQHGAVRAPASLTAQW